jgi:DNA-directed RNA polymerase subunit RPC12/RpoP
MKFRIAKRTLEAGDELGVDWERWANGQAWRLKRKRDFGDVDPSIAMEAAGNAADRMGKAVLSVRDRHFPKKYVWVQFADDRIRAGNPCPCGSRRLLGLHPNFVRCPECGAMLLVQTSSGAEEYESRPAFRLGRLKGVHLAWLERVENRDVYRGYGDKEGAPVVVIAEFRVEGDGDEELSAEHAFERVEKVQVLPFDRLSDVFDVSALRNDARADWDLVL